MTVAVWTGLHAQQAPDAPLTVVRITMARLPRRDTPPQPLWLAWVVADGTPPDELRLFWTWYARRFPIEQGFRFAKQTVGWTTVRPRDPPAAAVRPPDGPLLDVAGRPRVLAVVAGARPRGRPSAPVGTPRPR